MSYISDAIGTWEAFRTGLTRNAARSMATIRESPADKDSALKSAKTPHNRPSWLTLPNIVTGLRAVGSPAMMLLALDGQPIGVAAVVGAMVFTEWLDGFLARTLHQHSALGARLDTIADASFYTSLLVALVILNHNHQRGQASIPQASIPRRMRVAKDECPRFAAGWVRVPVLPQKPRILARDITRY